MVSATDQSDKFPLKREHGVYNKEKQIKHLMNKTSQNNQSLGENGRGYPGVRKETGYVHLHSQSLTP